MKATSHHALAAAPDEFTLFAADEAVLGQNHKTGDSFLIEVSRQFVQLHGQVFFPWHGVHEAIEAVDDDDFSALGIDGLTDHIGELARGQFGDIDLPKQKLTIIHKGFGIEPEAFQPRQIRGNTFVE